MKTKLFIDFDGTLFNTSKLKEKFIALLGEYGVSRDDLMSAYRDECKDNLFTVMGVLKRVHTLTDHQRAEIVELEKDLHKNNPELLYDDVLPFLNNVDRDKYELIMITLGDPDFHRYKVGYTGISDYFDHIYFITCEKWDYLDSVVNANELFCLIDDREDTCYFVQHKFKKSKTFCIFRDDRDSDDPVLNKKFDDIKIIHSLEEAIS